jgi:tetratricopeptide (TPR) repeat protein
MLSRAEQEYRTIASTFPNDTFSQFRLSRVQSVLSTKRQNEVSSMSREAGLRKFRMSDYAGAEKDLAAAVDAGRTDTAALYALGMSRVKLGYYEKAQRALDQCVAANPDYAPALVGLAQASAAVGKQDQAVSLLERALALGGGAEFTPVKIEEMLAALIPARPVSSPSARSSAQNKRPEPTFFARAVHGHAFPLTWCSGELEIINSVVHFNASKPSHSFQVLSSGISESQVIGNELHFNVNGRHYGFTLKGRSPLEFLEALRR